MPDGIHRHLSVPERSLIHYLTSQLTRGFDKRINALLSLRNNFFIQLTILIAFP